MLVPGVLNATWSPPRYKSRMHAAIIFPYFSWFKDFRRSSWKYNPCLRGWTIIFFVCQPFIFWGLPALKFLPHTYGYCIVIWLLAAPQWFFPQAFLNLECTGLFIWALIRHPQYQWVAVYLQKFFMYNSPVYDINFPSSVQRALMESVLSSTIIFGHIFEPSGYSLDLELLVLFIFLHFPITLRLEARWGVSESPGLGLLHLRSARAIDTERYGRWGFSASSPLRDRPPMLGVPSTFWPLDGLQNTNIHCGSTFPLLHKFYVCCFGC